MNRGEVWLGNVGKKKRPVIILTRSIVIDVRQLVTVAEVTTNIRGTNAEVSIDPDVVGLHQPSVINCDGIHTIPKNLLEGPIGFLDGPTLEQLSRAVKWALGC